MAYTNPGPIQQKPTGANKPAQATAQTPAQQINQAMQQSQPTQTPVQTATAPGGTGAAYRAAANKPNSSQPSAPISTNKWWEQPSAQTKQTAQTTQEATGNVYFVGGNGSGPKGMKVGDQVVTASGTYTVMGINPDGSYQSKLTNANQTTGNYTGAYANHTGKVYQVGADSNAPKGLQVGDQVVTGGGTYTITGVNPDGSYSKILSNRGQTTGNFTGQYSTVPGTAPATQQAQSNTPAFAQSYDKNVNYADEIQKARQAGNIAAAAQLEQLRNQKIVAEGLPYEQTNYYSAYLSQVSPEYAEILKSGYTEMKPTMRQNPWDEWKGIAEQERDIAMQSAENDIKYATDKAVNEKQRIYEDALPQFQQQLDQLDIDTARAMSNSALYAEMRGDRGGIGQSQYNEVQAQALRNKQAINTARMKLATDTARDIADFRAQGDHELAKQVLQIRQQTLSRLFEIAQLAEQWYMSQEEVEREMAQTLFNQQVQEANLTGTYKGQPTLSSQKYDQETARDLATAFLNAGLSVPESLFNATGWNQYANPSDTSRLASAIAAQMGFSGGGSSGGGRSSGGGSRKSSGSGSGSGSKSGSGSPTAATADNTGGLGTESLKALQRALGVTADGIWGPQTQAAAGGLSPIDAYNKYVAGNRVSHEDIDYKDASAVADAVRSADAIRQMMLNGASKKEVSAKITELSKAGYISDDAARRLRAQNNQRP